MSPVFSGNAGAGRLRRRLAATPARAVLAVAPTRQGFGAPLTPSSSGRHLVLVPPSRARAWLPPLFG